ncbi:hypothetical protein AB1Y20_023517 [Prymnesium parvum]|uniref:Uncharacterized protein n=1 Tax=Prymnesium parvum TaxID=97485 RepID=A0AB34JEH5_PRYPA
MSNPFSGFASSAASSWAKEPSPRRPPSDCWDEISWGKTESHPRGREQSSEWSRVGGGRSAAPLECFRPAAPPEEPMRSLHARPAAPAVSAWDEASGFNLGFCLTPRAAAAAPLPSPHAPPRRPLATGGGEAWPAERARSLASCHAPLVTKAAAATLDAPRRAAAEGGGVGAGGWAPWGGGGCDGAGSSASSCSTSRVESYVSVSSCSTSRGEGSASAQLLGAEPAGEVVREAAPAASPPPVSPVMSTEPLCESKEATHSSLPKLPSVESLSDTSAKASLLEEQQAMLLKLMHIVYQQSLQFETRQPHAAATPPPPSPGGPPSAEPSSPPRLWRGSSSQLPRSSDGGGESFSEETFDGQLERRLSEQRSKLDRDMEQETRRSDAEALRQEMLQEQQGSAWVRLPDGSQIRRQALAEPNGARAVERALEDAAAQLKRTLQMQQAAKEAAEEERRLQIAEEERSRREAERKTSLQQQTARRGCLAPLLDALQRKDHSQPTVPPEVMTWALKTAFSQLDLEPRGFQGGLNAPLGASAQSELVGQLQLISKKMAELQAEVTALREGGGKKSRREKGSRHAESSEDEDEAAIVKAEYIKLRDDLVGALTRGESVPEGTHAARDMKLHQLQDDELQAEYAWYSSLYLADDTKPAVRGMAEMTLMKMGTLLETPYAKRVKMVAKAAEEQKQAAESRKRNKEQSEKEAADRARQQALNLAAYENGLPTWQKVSSMSAEEMENAADDEVALFKRMAKLPELRLLTSSEEELRKTSPASFAAMGTSGLKASEARALLHVLENVAKTYQPAGRFCAMLKERVAKLPEDASLEEDSAVSSGRRPSISTRSYSSSAILSRTPPPPQQLPTMEPGPTQCSASGVPHGEVSQAASHLAQIIYYGVP